MIREAKLENLKIGLKVVYYPTDKLIQVVDEVNEEYISTHYINDQKFHLKFKTKNLGKKFYKLYFDDEQISLFGDKL